MADKVLQLAVAKLLEAIYAADFLPCSYGYRPRRGALDAVRDLSRTLQDGDYHFVEEADIQGYFDPIDCLASSWRSWRKGLTTDRSWG
ncbi:MAG: hypothetical protein ACRERU_08660 [Methylococcales bacterium]